MNQILELEGIQVNFGGVVAIKDLSISLRAGEISGVIGPNGAGKTTLFNVITGVVQPSAGRIMFDGTELKKERPHRIARTGIARTFQNIRLFKDLTVQEHLLAMGPMRFRLRRNREWPDTNEILQITGLWEERHRVAEELPYGLQRRVEIARALAVNPKLLLLDEPVAGMNSGEADELADLIRSLRDGGLSILLIEHDMKFVMSLCDQLFVLNFGSLIASGDPRSIQQNEAVLEAYLGEEVSQ